LIRYHRVYPDATDPYYQYNIPEVTSRDSYYGNNYAPRLFIDGNIDGGAGHSTWGTSITSELAVSSPLDIDINGEYNRATRNGHVDLTIVATAAITNTNLKVRIGIIESNINLAAPNGTTIHNQTFRDLTPNATGVPLTIALGGRVNLTQSFSCPSPLVAANSEVVVFVQSDSGHRILQGAKRNVMSMSYFLNPFTLISPPNGSIADSCTPPLIWHRSQDPDSGFQVKYKVYLNFNSSFDNPFIVSDTLTDTIWTAPLCLPNDSTYYWQVVAFNGHAPDKPCSAVFHFDVREPIINPFTLISPTNGTTVDSCTPPLIWHKTVDLNSGVAVKYKVYLTYNGSFETPFIISDTLSDTSWTAPLCLPNDSTYHWKVMAFNGHASDRQCDDVFSFTVHEPAGCSYVAGDANYNWAFNGVDVVYSVSYFKGGVPPPYSCECTPGHTWFVTGDVNASCNFNGVDVTYMVAYFKGGPPAHPCPDCAPVAR
jgi:hypothetical protein